MKTALLLAACIAVPNGSQHYRVINEIGIVGQVIWHEGTSVMFKPCVGPVQVLWEGAIEPTLNTCADGKQP